MKYFKFTKAKIDQLPAPNLGRTEYKDTEVSGLMLRVTAKGVKSYCINRYKEKKFIRVTIGRHPDISVDTARAKALEYLADVAITGKNPNEKKRAKKLSTVTLQEALKHYVESRGERLKPATAKQYRSVLINYSGDWMDKPLMDISRDKVEERHRSATKGTVWFGVDKKLLRAGVGTGSKAQADLWARALRAVWSFAHEHYRSSEDSPLFNESPTKVLSAKRQWNRVGRKSDRIRTHELARWFGAVEKVRNEAIQQRDDIIAVICDALDVAIFTGLRRSEIFGLEWSRVNFEGLYFWIDTSKNGDPLELPMTDSLLTIFRRRLADKKDGCNYVFPSVTGKIISDPRRAINKIVSATIPPENVENLKAIEFKCHDARRTFGTVAELAGVGTYILKRLMNHRTIYSSDVTQGYIHFSAEELRIPATKIENEILKYAGINKNATLDDKMLLLLNGLTDVEKADIINSLIDKLK
ncbi:tyrosine-type recombinase/integrase [Yersinia enterocolitica]|nr:site-specific integrase [Yersinia enterocolitica]EKN3499876.1 site-specific integrase [Yersinia enterocolitica]EKN3971167.1 site-specific integrase [Yersinia enterocolitica]EKN4026115.1 site-specific integrase [Yersinia enterocolitica]EKN4060634.1 site-specific integrase [Yersinia enterocolitica]